ncbi:MAG: hypothetical protein J6Z79_04775 [Clostridia bacterium]|nr:hypothetical protein [Clostridia bacterium]
MSKNKQPDLKQFLRQFIRFSPRQMIMMLAGNLVLALGVALFGQAGLGNHPFHTMLYAAGELAPGDMGWNYVLFQILLNVVLFVVIFLVGRKHIGLGTIVNMFLLSPVINLLTILMNSIGLTPAAGEGAYLVSWLGLKNVWQLVMEIAATVLISLGISLYQAGKLGAAPYDALPLVAVDHGKPFAPWRMLCDGSCLILTAVFLFLCGLRDLPAGGMGFGDFLSFMTSAAPEQARIGLGTVITVFCTGPFIHFFDRTVSEKIMGKGKAE